MPCIRTGNAIICTTTRRCACGAPAKLLCDWKLKPTPGAKSHRGTCNAPVCDACTLKPAEGKDLCRKHQVHFRQWQARQRIKAGAK